MHARASQSSKIDALGPRPSPIPRNYRNLAVCAPWLAARDRARREAGSRRSGVGKRGWRRREYYAEHPPRWGWKPAELLPSGSEWGPSRELGQGKTTLNPRYQPPGAISARRSSLLPRLVLIPPSPPPPRSTTPLSDDFFEVSIFARRTNAS